MRYFLLATLLVVSFPGPGSALPAVQSGTLSYSLSGPPTTSTSTSFNATIGGVQGTIKTTASAPTTTTVTTGTTTTTTTSAPTGGTWTMTVAGQTFASGKYSCSGGSCSFTGATLAGKTLSFSMTGTSGTLSNVFANHGAWVSTVAGWANGHLSSRNRGDVVSQASGGKGHDLSHDTSHGSAQTASNLAQGGGSTNGNGAEHGGGQGHNK